VKLLLRTFGCRANHYDAEQVRAMAERAGARIVESAADAPEVAVFTSCAVTSDAEADLRQAVRRFARERPGARVIVTGCAAARSPEAIGALAGVSDVIGGADLAAVAQALGLAPLPLRRASRQSTARATLRVQDGCDEHCTFCATTLARGAHRSRTVEDLVEEARVLAEHHPEIVLTGIHVGSWGKEVGATLGALVRALVDGVPKARFRLASVEATEVDAELAELLRDGGDRVCPYLHAPLQSGSDAVLRRMGRHWYTAREYADAIRRLTNDRAVFGLGADVMTGFPGETEADHAATLALVRALPFTHLHVFPYSERPGTAASRLGPSVPPAVARERAAELRGLGAEKAAGYAASRVGGTADAVVIGPAAGGPALRTALTEDYLEVQLRGLAPRGSRLRVRLEADALASPES
jgi:threonylcarbamoyladenosine tRNA methylthiotransferase MtaB